MHGTIFVNANAGRLLRKQGGAVLAVDVLDCAGGFRAGDRVHIVVRGVDGGQGVIAIGVTRYGQRELLQAKGRSSDSPEPPGEDDAPAVVISARDLHLLWPSSP